MKILTDENGEKWEVVSHHILSDGHSFFTRPLPPPAKSLEEEVKEELDSIPSECSDNYKDNRLFRTEIAICRVIEKRLAKLEGK